MLDTLYRIFAEFFGRKHKTPLYFGKINHIKLNNILPTQAPKSKIIYLQNPNNYIGDYEYKLPTKKQIEDFLKYDNISFQKFRKEANDCDNFAIQLAGRLNEAFPGFAVGFAISDIHAFNIFVDNEEKVWLIEPQTDRIFAPTEKIKKYIVKVTFI